MNKSHATSTFTQRLVNKLEDVYYEHPKKFVLAGTLAFAAVLAPILYSEQRGRGEEAGSVAMAARQDGFDGFELGAKLEHGRGEGKLRYGRCALNSVQIEVVQAEQGYDITRYDIKLAEIALGEGNYRDVSITFRNAEELTEKIDLPSECR